MTKHSADFDHGFRRALDAAAFAIEGFADATQKNFIEATKPLPEPLKEFTWQLEPAVKSLIESMIDLAAHVRRLDPDLADASGTETEAPL
jgi:hypothetical protein